MTAQEQIDANNAKIAELQEQIKLFDTVEEQIALSDKLKRQGLTGAALQIEINKIIFAPIREIQRLEFANTSLLKTVKPIDEAIVTGVIRTPEGLVVSTGAIKQSDLNKLLEKGFTFTETEQIDVPIEVPTAVNPQDPFIRIDGVEFLADPELIADTSTPTRQKLLLDEQGHPIPRNAIESFEVVA